MKNNKTVLIASVVIVIALIILTITGSYAFYTSVLSPSGNNTGGASAADLRLKFTDTTADEYIEIANLIPGDKVIKTFTVENIGTATIKFKIVVNDIVNDAVTGFKHIEDFTIDVYEGNHLINTTTFPTTTSPISGNDALIIEPESGEVEYKVVITYKNTDNPNQMDDMEKTLSAKIFIEAVG